jgi:hypothetical protein
MIRALLASVLAATLSGCSHLVVLHDPLTAAEHNDLGVAYEQRQKTELAEREYQNALRKDPPSPRASISATWRRSGSAEANDAATAARCSRPPIRRDEQPAVVLLNGESLREGRVVRLTSGGRRSGRQAIAHARGSSEARR